MAEDNRELQEKDFIQDNIPKPELPFWTWGAILTTILALAWGIGSQMNFKMEQKMEDSPFLQVTNRDLSVFLWQFPEYMRVNAKQGKAGYLPAFRYSEKLNIEDGMADQYAVAPPELLFLYHTWKRLIANEFTTLPIQLSEFKEFLLYANEWQPKNWKDAPKDYADFANKLLEQRTIQPGQLPDITPPKEVTLAFQGWKDFFKNGEAVNQIAPTYGQMASFINSHPHYARNYWRNILIDQKPQYLKTLTSGNYSPTVAIPSDELAPFLKVAFYDYQQSLK